MQPFVEEQVGFGRQILPLRESSGLLLIACRLHVVVEITPETAAASFAITTEELLQFREKIRVRTKMTEIGVAARDGFGQTFFHFDAVVAVEAIPFARKRPAPSRDEISARRSY